MKKIDYKAYCQIVVDTLNETADDLEDVAEKMKQVAEIVTLSLILIKKNNIQIDAPIGSRGIQTMDLALNIAERVMDELGE